MTRPLSISVVIPTYKRIPVLLRTLKVLSDFDAGPAEVIVHVDGGDLTSVAAIRHFSKSVRVIQTHSTLGPGGSRNKLLSEAKYDIVVSLDDDSFPIDADFFPAVMSAVERHPSAGVIAMYIIHDGEAPIERCEGAHPVCDFVGCGCVYRKKAFLSTRGYVPIQPAYGVEETDLALQIIDNGWDIIHDHDLRVCHATTRSHQASTTITAAHISNLALLAFLRYPIPYLPLGLLQVISRIVWSIRNGRISGIMSGIAAIPGKIWQFRSYRKSVSCATMRNVRYLRRQRQDVQVAAT